MKYTLYHKIFPVITFELDEDGYVTEIYKVENKKHIPVQFLENGKLLEEDGYYSLYDKIVRWLAGRGVPLSRKNIKTVLAKLNLSNTDEFAKRSFYLSLSDQYWAAPADKNLDWEKINFFTNKFSDDVGALLIDRKPRGNSLNLNSPNNTSQGNLKKKWVIRNGKRVLVKGGSGIEQLEPFNEVLASEIYRRLGINHVDYEFFVWNRKHYSRCQNFINKDTELVTAYELCSDKATAFDDYISLSDIQKRCELYKIPFDLVELGKMFVVDFIIANVDRHTNNFGFIRNANTLEWIGLAPVFDSGNSMFMNLQSFELEKNGQDSSAIEAKPFCANQLEQLNLFPLKEIAMQIDLDKLKGIGQFYKELLNKNQRNIDREKIEKLALVLEERIKETNKIFETSL